MRPVSVAYVMWGQEKWWWRERKVVHEGSWPDKVWKWKLGPWEGEEKEWSVRRKGWGRPKRFAEEETKERAKRQKQEWAAAHKDEVQRQGERQAKKRKQARREGV